MQRTAWGLVVALWGAGLGSAAQYGKFSLTFDRLPALYPKAGMDLGFVVSLVGLTGVFLGVVAALLAARIGFRRALLWALWTGAGVSFFQALVPPMPWLLASRVLEGMSHLAIVVVAPTLIAQLCRPSDRSMALTLWGTFFGVGFAALAWAGLPIVNRFGLPALLVVHGIYMAGFALLLGRALQRLHQPVAMGSDLAQMVRRHLAIYQSPAIFAPAAGWLFYTFAFVALMTVLPPFLDPAQRVLIIGSMPLVSIAVSMTIGIGLLRVVSAVAVICMGFFAASAATVWLTVIPGAPTACLVLAAAMGLVQGASFAAVPQLNADPALQVQANGAMAQTGNIGNTLGTPVLVTLIAAFGYPSLPIALGITFFGGLAVHLLLALRRNAG